MQADELGGSGGGIGCVVALISFVVFGLVGWAMGRGKGRGGLGFILGAFLGVIGLIIMAFIGDSGGSRRIVRRTHPILRRPGAGPAGRIPRR